MRQSIPVRLRVIALLLSVMILTPLIGARAEGASRYDGPTNSGPISLSADGTLLAAVNSGYNTVSLFDVGNDKNQLLGEIPVGKEPGGVAMTPDVAFVYVAN